MHSPGWKDYVPHVIFGGEHNIIATPLFSHPLINKTQILNMQLLHGLCKTLQRVAELQETPLQTVTRNRWMLTDLAFLSFCLDALRVWALILLVYFCAVCRKRRPLSPLLSGSQTMHAQWPRHTPNSRKPVLLTLQYSINITNNRMQGYTHTALTFPSISTKASIATDQNNGLVLKGELYKKVDMIIIVYQRFPATLKYSRPDWPCLPYYSVQMHSTVRQKQS